MTHLDEKLLAAHAAANIPALVQLYETAANAAVKPGAEEFYLTQAYVYALDIGHKNAVNLHDKLKRLGCEE